jgi:hypothetical protein
MHFANKERGESNLDTLSPQHKTNASITPTTEEASKDIMCLQNQFCLLTVEETKICIVMHILLTRCICLFHNQNALLC